MSKFKQYFRQILCIAGFMLIAIMFAFNPVLSANALQTQELDNAISAVHLPTTLVNLADEDKTNNELVIPLLNFKNNSKS